MTKRFMFLLALLALLSFTFVACDDDNDSKTDNEPTVDADSTPDPDVVPDTDTPISDLCKDVDCSGKGTCEVVQNSAGEDVAECACNDGFAWAGRNHEVCVCYNDDAKVVAGEGWESYLGFNISTQIVGSANELSGLTQPSAVIGKLANNSDKTFASAGSYAVATNLSLTDGSTAPGVVLVTMSDPVGNYYSMATQVIMLSQNIQAIAASTEAGGLGGSVDFAQQTSVIKLWSDYSTEDGKKAFKQCITAVPVFANNTTAGGEMPVGTTKFCAEDTTTFVKGDTLSMLMTVQLTDKAEDIVAMYDDINSVDDLCTCFETDGGDHNGDGDTQDTVDCTTGTVVENCDATGNNCVEVTPPTDNDPVVDEDVVVPVDEDVVVPVDEDVVVPVDEEPVVDADPVD